jgi:type IV pilus assembly protein PilZ
VTDHREHERAPIELRVEYKSLNSFFAEYTRNISKGGAFIRTKKPLPVGTRFLFKLSVPSRPEPLAVEGEVIRVEAQGEGAGMGIRFDWSGDAARSAFDREVESLMAESLGPIAAAGLMAEARK